MKPVSPKLLSARLQSLLRRTPKVDERGVVRAGGVTLDIDRRQVEKDGVKVALTPTEFRLLQVLAEHSGRPCSRRFLLQQVWGDDFMNCTHYLRLYIGYLREKLEDDPKKPRMLVTDWGHGYRLVAEGGRAAVPAVKPAPQAAIA